MQLPDCFGQDNLLRTLPRGTLRVAVFLAFNHSYGGSHKALGRRLGLSKGTVDAALRQLQSLGLLIRLGSRYTLRHDRPVQLFTEDDVKAGTPWYELTEEARQLKQTVARLGPAIERCRYLAGRFPEGPEAQRLPKLETDRQTAERAPLPSCWPPTPPPKPAATNWPATPRPSRRPVRPMRPGRLRRPLPPHKAGWDS